MRFSLSPRTRRKRLFALAVSLIGVAAATTWLWRTFAPAPRLFTEDRGGLLDVNVGEPVTEADGFVGQAIGLTSGRGLAVNLRVLRPAAIGHRLPLVILLGGHRTGRDAVDVLGNPGRMAVAALDYPYHGPEKPRGARQILQCIPAIQQGLLDTPPAVSLAL